jgi:hypothetical protein
VPFSTGIIYIEGIVHLLIKKLLAKQVQLNDADQIIQLALRGLGIPPKKISNSQEIAKKFVSELTFKPKK